jgi:hypothetical protein
VKITFYNLISETISRNTSFTKVTKYLVTIGTHDVMSVVT